MLIALLFACWDPPDSAPEVWDSTPDVLPDDTAGCGLEMSNRAPSGVSVLEWAVDGGGTVPTVDTVCASEDGTLLSIGLDVDGDIGLVAINAPGTGAWNLPDEEVVTNLGSGSLFWNSEDVYSGSLAISSSSEGSLEVDATGDDGQISAELTWSF